MNKRHLTYIQAKLWDVIRGLVLLDGNINNRIKQVSSELLILEKENMTPFLRNKYALLCDNLRDTDISGETVAEMILEFQQDIVSELSRSS